jgi:hypothetical protein
MKYWHPHLPFGQHISVSTLVWLVIKVFLFKSLFFAVKTIVKSAKYPVDNMPSLWKTITLFHKDKVPEIITLAQYAFTLPLHTCSCERVIKVFLFKSLFFAALHLFKELCKSCLAIPLPCVLTLKSLSLILGISLDLSLVTIKFWLLKTLSQLQVWSGKVNAHKDFYYIVDSLY